MDLDRSRPPSAVPSLKRSSERGARSALIAFVSTLVFFGVFAVVVVNSEAWPAFRNQFFNGEVFVDAWPIVVSGFWLDIQMFVVAEIAILALGVWRSVRRRRSTVPSAMPGEAHRRAPFGNWLAPAAPGGNPGSARPPASMRGTGSSP